MSKKTEKEKKRLMSMDMHDKEKVLDPEFGISVDVIRVPGGVIYIMKHGNQVSSEFISFDQM